MISVPLHNFAQPCAGLSQNPKVCGWSMTNCEKVEEVWSLKQSTEYNLRLI